MPVGGSLAEKLLKWIVIKLFPWDSSLLREPAFK